MKYIDSLQEGMRISEVYLCKSKQIALTKTGKEYGRLMLQDKTGTVDAKIWNLNSPGVGTFEAMENMFLRITCRYPRKMWMRCTRAFWGLLPVSGILISKS